MRAALRNFDAPVRLLLFFSIAWMVGVWAIQIRLRRRTRTAYTEALTIETTTRPAIRPVPATVDGFVLTTIERNIFGVHQEGEVVTFGPSARQYFGAIVACAVAGGGGLALTAARLNIWTTALGIAVGIAIVATGVAGLQVGVELSPGGVKVKSRFRSPRTFTWNEIANVRVAIRRTRFGLQGATSHDAVGMLDVVGSQSIPLPCCRHLAWIDDSGWDELTPTLPKVAIIRRYMSAAIRGEPGASDSID